MPYIGNRPSAKSVSRNALKGKSIALSKFSFSNNSIVASQLGNASLGAANFGGGADSQSIAILNSTSSFLEGLWILETTYEPSAANTVFDTTVNFETGYDYKFIFRNIWPHFMQFGTSDQFLEARTIESATVKSGSTDYVRFEVTGVGNAQVPPGNLSSLGENKDSMFVGLKQGDNNNGPAKEMAFDMEFYVFNPFSSTEHTTFYAPHAAGHWNGDVKYAVESNHYWGKRAAVASAEKIQFKWNYSTQILYFANGGHIRQYKRKVS